MFNKDKNFSFAKARFLTKFNDFSSQNILIDRPNEVVAPEELMFELEVLDHLLRRGIRIVRCGPQEHEHHIAVSHEGWI